MTDVVDTVFALDDTLTVLALDDDVEPLYPVDPEGSVAAALARANAELAETSHLEALADALAAEAARNAAEDARTDALAAAAEAEADAATAGGYLAAIEAITGGSTIVAELTFQAKTRAIMAAFTSMTEGDQCFLSEDGRIGLFVWDDTDLSDEVDDDPYQGLFVPPLSDTTGASGAWKRLRNSLDFWASWYGAPSGTADGDGMIFSSISGHAQDQGGGHIILGRPTLIGVGSELYIVGANQIHNNPDSPSLYRFAPEVEYPLDFVGCNKPHGVKGNGSIIRCADGAKYGVFNHDGTVWATGAGYLGVGFSTPYFGMVRGEDYEDLFTLEGVELDGNLENITVGGHWGSGGGWQIACTGYALIGGTGGACIKNGSSHHHAQDGGNYNGNAASDLDPDENVEISNFKHFCNLRNNFSLTRGKGVRFRNGCTFDWSCKPVPGDDTPYSFGYSPPAAGIDIECEGGVIRDVLLEDFQIVGNYQVGLLCVPSNIMWVTLRRGRVIGTTSYSIWGEALGIRAYDMLFVGAMVNLQPSNDPRLAAQFRRSKCVFGSARSPTGNVFLPGTPLMADLGGLGSINILFEDFTFDSEGNTDAIIPFTGGGAIFRGKTIMKQDGTDVGYPRGFYDGDVTITTNGTIDPTDIINYGRLSINGTQHERYVPSDLRAETTVKGRKLVANTVGDGHAADLEDMIEVVCDRAAGGKKAVVFKDGDGNILGRLGVKLVSGTAYLSFSDFLGSSSEFARLGGFINPDGLAGFNLTSATNGYFFNDKKLIGARAPHIANATNSSDVVTRFNELLYYLSAGAGGYHELFEGP